MDLTNAERHVMECLWEHSPRTGREAAQWLEERMGWSRSTTLTLLRRMETKGAVSSSVRDGLKVFSPEIRREEAALRETEDLLSRVYQGSLSLMVSAMTRRRDLSREEIDELYEILRQAEENRRDEK